MITCFHNQILSITVTTVKTRGFHDGTSFIPIKEKSENKRYSNSFGYVIFLSYISDEDSRPVILQALVVFTK